MRARRDRLRLHPRRQHRPARRKPFETEDLEVCPVSPETHGRLTATTWISTAARDPRSAGRPPHPSTPPQECAMRRFVDISVPLMAGIASDPASLLPEIDYYTHEQTAEDVVSYFPGATVDDLPDREGWAIERVRMATHSGTHLDAPYHYSAIMDLAIVDGGTRAITIDEVPLEWCLQPGVKLDFRHFPDGYVVTAANVEAELQRIDHQLSPLEIVVVNTAAGVRYGSEDYVASGCGMGREATLCLLERGVRPTGKIGRASCRARA